MVDKPKAGLILKKDDIKKKYANTANVAVSWKWYDEAQGLVEWTFVNNGASQATGLLYRVNYPFGNAFWCAYENNAVFDTSFETSITPLVDKGVELNSAPLAIFQNPDGSLFVAFNFTLSPKQSWSMIEGGFSASLLPNTGMTPIFVPAVEVGVKSYNITYDTTNCEGYIEQTNSTGMTCPANPVLVKSMVLTLSTQIPPLTNDTFTPVLTSSNSNNYCDTILDGLISYFSNL